MAQMAILPRDISLKPQGENIHAFAGFFGKFEMDVVARIIVSQLAKQNEWRAITFSEVLSVSRYEDQIDSEKDIIEGWECLLDYLWLTRDKGRFFTVSEAFIKRCKDKSDELKQ